MRARCRCTISHGQSGSDHRTPGIRREAKSIGIASYSGLKEGRSVSAVERAATDGLGEVLRWDLHFALLRQILQTLFWSMALRGFFLHHGIENATRIRFTSWPARIFRDRANWLRGGKSGTLTILLRSCWGIILRRGNAWATKKNSFLPQRYCLLGEFYV